MYIGRYHPSLDVHFSVLALGSMSTLLEMVWKRLVHQDIILCMKILVLGEKYSLYIDTYDYRLTYKRPF